VEAEAEVTPAAEAAPPPPGTASQEAEAPALPKSGTCPIPGLEPIDLSTLPPIEELSLTSDLAPFLRPGIPAALRSAALRRMWSLDPAIRDYIGPVEYQWDFNTPGGLPAGFASELVGDVKTLLAQAIGEPAEEKAPSPAEPLPEPATGDAEAPPMAMAEPPPMVPPGVTLAEAPAAPPLPAPEPDPEPRLPPRRRQGSALPA
jgi:hypothetical protein